MMSSRDWSVLVFLFVSLISLAGCGQDGPVRYSLSGTVTMPDGKPVPAGEVSLEPDGAAGNQGPATMVQIRDGKYSAPRDQGIVGGAYIITISPFDGVPFGESLQGKPLTKTQHVEKVDFPAKNSTYDFKIKVK
jgi:predicted small lipoprotein YifL